MPCGIASFSGRVRTAGRLEQMRSRPQQTQGVSSFSAQASLLTQSLLRRLGRSLDVVDEPGAPTSSPVPRTRKYLDTTPHPPQSHLRNAGTTGALEVCDHLGHLSPHLRLYTHQPQKLHGAPFRRQCPWSSKSAPRRTHGDSPSSPQGVSEETKFCSWKAVRFGRLGAVVFVCQKRVAV